MDKIKIIAVIIIAVLWVTGFMFAYENVDKGWRNTYTFVMVVEKCNTLKVDTISFETKGYDENYFTSGEAVPVLKIGKKKFLKQVLENTLLL